MQTGASLTKKEKPINIKSSTPLLCIPLILHVQVYKLTDIPVKLASALHM